MMTKKKIRHIEKSYKRYATNHETKLFLLSNEQFNFYRTTYGLQAIN
jgi:hypothetical protein